MRNKKILILLGLCVFCFVGCTNKKVMNNKTNLKMTSDNKKMEQNEQQVQNIEKNDIKSNKKKDNEKLNQELIDIFNIKQSKLQYNGYAEYGYYLTNKGFKNNTMFLEGKLNDGTEKDNKFLINYKINSNNVICNIENNERHILNSIIPNEIVLQLPLVEKNTWTQEFKYKNETYKAITTIDNIDMKDGIKKITTITKVKGINNVHNGVYVEKKVFETNKGLVSFGNTNSNYSDDPLDEILGTNFGYSLRR